MECFWIRQDSRYIHTPMIVDFYQSMRRQNFTVDKEYKIPDYNVVFCDTDKEWDRIDVLDSQVFMVSEMVKHVFQIYEKNIRYKFFCCLNNKKEEYANYYAQINLRLTGIRAPVRIMQHGRTEYGPGSSLSMCVVLEVVEDCLGGTAGIHIILSWKEFL